MIEEVKKLVDEMKNLYKCNFATLPEQTAEKANKTIENFQENSLSLSLFIALFP